ncbi:MAG: hypothetical protein JSR99_03580 [Proteobacteria bacterium]|nr:hypothetical protein [Pseudomonadota bacterium]
MPPELLESLHRLLDAFGAKRRKGVSRFARIWRVTGEVEDFAAMAEDPYAQHLAELLRAVVLDDLRHTAPFEDAHPDARAVEELFPLRKRSGK